MATISRFDMSCQQNRQHFEHVQCLGQLRLMSANAEGKRSRKLSTKSDVKVVDSAGHSAVVFAEFHIFKGTYRWLTENVGPSNDNFDFYTSSLEPQSRIFGQTAYN